MKSKSARLGLLGLALLLEACAQKGGVQATSTPEEIRAVPPQIEWSAPDDAIEVPNVAEGKKLLRFDPIISGLPEGTRIYVSDPSDVDIDHRGIVFVSEEASGDPYWVIESIAEMTQDDLRNEIEMCVPPVQCSGSRSMVTVRGKHEALLIEKGNQTTVVIWFEDGLHIQVQGPPATFTAEDAIAVANDL